MLYRKQLYYFYESLVQSSPFLLYFLFLPPMRKEKVWPLGDYRQLFSQIWDRMECNASDCTEWNQPENQVFLWTLLALWSSRCIVLLFFGLLLTNLPRYTYLLCIINYHPSIPIIYILYLFGSNIVQNTLDLNSNNPKRIISK